MSIYNNSVIYVVKEISVEKKMYEAIEIILYKNNDES